MAISETKMQMVIANYFKDECDVNTSIRQAFEKGFRIGVKKGASTNRPQGKWINGHSTSGFYYKRCDQCFAVIDDTFFGESSFDVNFCPNCGADMRGKNDE